MRSRDRLPSTGPTGPDAAAGSRRGRPAGQGRLARRGPRGRRALRLLLAGAAAMVALVVLLTVFVRPDGDPRGGGERGASVLAALLEQEGVALRAVSRVGAAAAAPPDGTAWTLVVGRSDALSQRDWERLLAAQPDDLVLLSPGQPSLDRLGLEVRAVTGARPSRLLAPGCTDLLAERAGPTSWPGAAQGPPPGQQLRGYTAGGSTRSCYPTGSVVHGYVSQSLGATRVHVLGTGWTNADVAVAGNASFAMQQLGRHRELTWLTDRGSPTEDDEPDPALLPLWWLPLSAQALAALGLLAWWRGRRLGPVVSEQLPVVVPAGEAVLGHGRLYHRLGARDHAAAALRGATLARLAARLGPQEPDALVEVVAAQTGLERRWLARVLSGVDPVDDDAALAELAAQLHEIESRLGRA